MFYTTNMSFVYKVKYLRYKKSYHIYNTSNTIMIFYNITVLRKYTNRSVYIGGVDL